MLLRSFDVTRPIDTPATAAFKGTPDHDDDEDDEDDDDDDDDDDTDNDNDDNNDDNDNEINLCLLHVCFGSF
jgi:hypothetical protein